MSNWRRWVRPGLAATVLLAFLAILIRSGAVGGDLGARVGDRLQSAGHGWASVAVSGRTVRIGGTAPTPESQTEALATASAVSGVRNAVDESDLLAIVSPYRWQATRSGRVVTLSGHVPSEAIRNSVLAAARRALPRAEIRDEMLLARGAPTSFNSATAFALDRLAGLTEGRVGLTDATLAISGVAATSASFADARAAFLNTIPASVNLGPVDVLPARAEPFVWSASYDGEAVTLDGYVPNQVVHETLVAAVRAVLSDVDIVDQILVASGEPEGFAEAAAFSIATLGRFSQGGITLDGLSLDIAGTARSVDDYEAVIATLTERLPKGMRVVSNEIVPAPVSPYGWSATKNPAGVVITGYVPHLTGHAEVMAVAAAVFPELDVIDNLRVAAGEPKMDWIGAIKFALGELSRLGNGSVSLGDRTYSIDGEAATVEAYADLLAINSQTLPASLELKDSNVRPPRVSPYRFVARRTPGRVTLAGYAPSEAEKAAIIEAAKRSFGAMEIVDDIGFASGAPDGFGEAAATVLQAVGRLAGGHGEIVDAAVAIEGGVYSPAAADAITAVAAESLPEGFTPTLVVVTRQPGQPLDPDRCRAFLQKELATGRIEFDGSGAEISRDSFGLLDRIAAMLGRCRDTEVEVGAHSDSTGSESRNRELTQARAEAIVDYLADAGVRRERLYAVGYGEANPIADNDTEAGKRANRRIEFSISVPEPAPVVAEKAPAGTEVEPETIDAGPADTADPADVADGDGGTD